MTATEGSHEVQRRPRDAIELIVHEAFCAVLTDRTVDLTTPFLDLGGHSLAALMLQDQLYEATGREISLDRLFVDGSVESIAEELRAAAPTGDRRSLCALAPAADRALYCVHSVVGTALRYRELAGLLTADRIQVLAYQAPGLVPGSEPVDSVETMARIYAAELLSTGRRDIELLGYSMGATVAYEMARHLLREGVGVRELYLVDTAAPGDLAAGEDAHTPVVHLANSLDGGWDSSVLDHLPDDEAYGHLFAHLRASSKIPPSYEINDLKRLGSVVAAHAAALARYRPPVDELDVPMTIFNASYSDLGPRDLGWSAFTSAEPRIVTLDAPHHLLLAEPTVQAIASAIVGARRG